MREQIKILMKLLSATQRMNDAIKSNDIDMLEQMLEERDGLLKEYQGINKEELSKGQQATMDDLIQLDKENNQLLEAAVQAKKRKLDMTMKEKNEAVKRTKIAKKYMSVGTGLGEYSRFNQKT